MLTITTPSGKLDSPHIAIHRNWFEKPEVLSKRLQQIIVGDVSHYDIRGDRLDDEVSRWHFDPANNWWLHLHPDEATFHLCYRYGKTHEQWSAMKVVLEMLLG